MKKYLAILLTLVMAACTTDPDTGGGGVPTTPEFVTAILGSTYTILGVEYRVEANGDLFVGDTFTYKYNSEYLTGTHAYYTTPDGTGFLGVEIYTGDPKVLSIYLEDQLAPWTGSIDDVSFSSKHKLGYISDFVTAALVDSPHTIAEIEYRVDITGDLYVGDTLTYKYVSEKTVGTQAIYTTADGAGFLGVALVEDPKVLAIYLKDKTTPWGVDTDVAYTPRHRVGVTSAFVTAVQALGNFTIFGDTAAVEYKMLDVGDVVKVSDGSVVYTYIDDVYYLDDTVPLRAYYSPVGNPAEFAGIGFPIVEPAPEGVFGFFNRTKAATHELNLYKSDGGNLTDGTYWTTVSAVDFIEKHLVGSGYVTLPFADWDSYGVIDEGITFLDRFATATFGNTIWIVGGKTRLVGATEDSDPIYVYKSVDAGKTWEKIPQVGLPSVRTPGLIATSETDLLLMGGDYGSSKARTYSSDDGGVNWTKGANFDGGADDNNNDNTTTHPRRVNGPVLLQHKGKQLLIGGVGVKWESFVWSSTDNTTWTRVTSAEEKHEGAGLSVTTGSYTPRAYHAAVSFKGDLYIMGGQNNPTLHTDVWKSVDDGATWTQIQTDVPWGTRTYLQAVVFNDEIYIFGGTETDNKDELIWKSADGINWTAVPVSTDKIGVRFRAGAVAITTDSGNKLDFVIFGGHDKNDTWRTGNYVNHKE